VGFYSQPQTTTEKQGKGTEQAGEHTTSRQNKGKGGGRKHGNQPWQAEEQKRKAEQATKQNHPAARQLKQDSKRKEQTHSWARGGDGTGRVGRRGKAKGSQAARTTHRCADVC